MKVAIFDFDGTLLDGNSWQLFFWWVVQRHPVRAPWLLLCLLLRGLRVVPARFLKEQTLAVVRDRTRQEVATLGARFWRQRLQPRLRPVGEREMADRAAAGCRLIVATGAFDFLVAPWAESRAAACLATRVAFDDQGRCCGRIAGPELVGDEKRSAVIAALATENVEWAASFAYGDEVSDLPTLALVGQPVFVRHRRRAPALLPRSCRVVEWR